MTGFASAGLQSAIFDALDNDTALNAKITAVYDEPAGGATYPYVVMGDGEVADRSTKTSSGATHRFRVDVWSDAAGRMETKEIMDLVHDVLHDTSLTINGHTLVTIRFENAEDERDDSGASVLYHGRMVFSAITQAL